MKCEPTHLIQLTADGCEFASPNSRKQQVRPQATLIEALTPDLEATARVLR